MTLDNVLPIDAEAARLLARRTTRFRWFVAALTAIWIAILVPVLIFTPLPPLGLLLVLAALVVLAEHRFILFGDETAMSGSILVVVCAVFASGSSAVVALPILVASLAGLYWRHVQQRQWALVLANATTLGIAAAIAAALTSTLVVSGTWSAAIGSAACVGAYWYVNSVLIGCASAIRHGDDIVKSVQNQATSEWPVLILSVAAALLSISVGDDGIVSIVVATALVLCVFELTVRLSSGGSHTTFQPRDIYIVALTSTLAIAAGGQDAIALVLVAAYLVTARRRDRLAPGYPFALVAIAWSTAFAAERLGLPPTMQLPLAAECALIGFVVHLLLRKRGATNGLGRHALLGLAMPNAREIGVVLATALAVQAALVSSPSVLVDVGLITAAALVGTLAPPTYRRRAAPQYCRSSAT